MRIATVGKAMLAVVLRICGAAGHEVTRMGRDGGDVSNAEVVLMAMPGGAIAEALANWRV